MYAMIKTPCRIYDPSGQLQRLRAKYHIFHATPRYGGDQYVLDRSENRNWIFDNSLLNLFPDDTIFLHGVADFPVTGSLEQVLSYISEREQRDWYFYPVSNERDITYGPSRRGRKHSASPKHDRWGVTSIADILTGTRTAERTAEPVGVREATLSIGGFHASMRQVSLQFPQQLTQDQTLATLLGVPV